MKRSSMPRSPGRVLGRSVALGFALSFVACSAPGGPDRYTNSEFPSSSAGSSGSTGGVVGTGGNTMAALTCTPAMSSEGMPARSTLTSQGGGAVQATYFTADLFHLFKSVCGGCHVENSLGSFSVSLNTFPTKVDESVYQIMTSNDPAVFMPPPTSGGIPYDQRNSSDALVQLAALMRLWLDQESPSDAFDLPAASHSGSSTGYGLTPALAAQLTNLGSCIPSKNMIAMNPSAMDQLDTFFAQATSLPGALDQTDLVSLDSATLAQVGVVSYAPTYPLWSDNAGKMRYVRVPRGQSIQLDKETQQFKIPPNTRFYKTFLKPVIDGNGNPAYRKVETRLIVSRPDHNLPDGTAQQTALFGTYVWNEDESQATLLTDPLRDGQPFADRLTTYVLDESKEQQIIDTNPRDLAGALESAGLTRHYALPGSERCIQCHMGSPSQSFVLGFTPLQVSRRATGTGGVYEPATGDELTQLQRLIDYGVISGVASAGDIAPLESSEGTRSPRNQQELAAQAYMVGNCAHCHNPRGFPSVKESRLKNVLIFLPGTGPGEGVFQLPLDLVSPIRQRGLNKDLAIPYITPSVYDVPRSSAIGKYFCPDTPDGSCEGAEGAPQFVLAPWRSLIYRNVDTPYDYFDDYTAFPHMPLNSPGYDCRVTTIMGDWMVSIPALLKSPDKIEDALPVNGDYPSTANVDPQPYRESKPGDADYSTAVAAATSRLSRYHNSGFRYGFCPSTYTTDIVDPLIEEEVSKNQPVTSDTGLILDPHDTSKVLMPILTPLRPNWVDYDDTDVPGDWFPRRPDWADALVNPNIPSFVADTITNDHISADAAEDYTNVLEALGTTTLTSDVKAALTQELPFGLWDTSISGCDFSGIPTADSFQGTSRPTWMAVAPPTASAPVYMESYGAAVFTTVCYNCHGVNADSKGLLADEISIMTGGDARVANFRDGLFGPVDQPGANRVRVFDPAVAPIGGGVTADDVAARYMAWMALGGTSKHLPQDVLAQVSDSPVLGQLRAHIALQGTPDMLRIGLDLCAQVATSSPDVDSLSIADLISSGRYAWSASTGLIDSNGDAEMWLRLCSLGNRPIVRVPVVNNGWTATTNAAVDLRITGYGLYWGTGPAGEDYYGANPVMDHRGNVANGINSANLFPLCIGKPADATSRKYADQALAAAQVNGKVIPYCPDGFVQASHQLQIASDTGDFVDGRKWAARGAINAAFAVFLYLDQVERDPTKRKPLYNQCNLLGQQ